MKHLTLLLAALFFAPAVVAQDEEEPEKATFNAQIRARAETDERDFNSDTDYNSYVLLRTRFSATFRPKKKYEALIQVQDSRVYGKEPTTLSDTRNLDLHQAYVLVRGFLWKNLDLKFGRMEVNYGEQRLIGAVDWSNVGRSFDGDILTWRITEKFKMDILSFYLEEASTPPTAASTTVQPGDKHDRVLGGVYMNWNRSDWLNADIYLLGEFDGTNVTGTSKDTLARGTVGTFVRGSIDDRWSYKAEFAYQGGKTGSLDLSAFMLTGSVTYAMPDAGWKPAFTLGYDYLSGDNDASDDKINVFNTLYATNHKFYGYMDYFTDIPVHTNGLGLQDLMVKVRVKPAKKLTLGMDVHHFMSAEKSGGESVFGQEVDLIGGWRFGKHFSWEAGLSVFVPGKLMQDRFGGNNDPGVWSHSTFVFSF